MRNLAAVGVHRHARSWSTSSCWPLAAPRAVAGRGCRSAQSLAAIQRQRAAATQGLRRTCGRGRQPPPRERVQCRGLTRDDMLGVAGPTPEHDRGCCLAAPARWRTPPAWFSANQTSRAPSSLVKHRVTRRRLHDVMISAGHYEPAANAANCRMAPPHRLWPRPRASDLGASWSACAITILGMFCLTYYARPPAWHPLSLCLAFISNSIHRRFIIQRGHEHTRRGN